MGAYRNLRYCPGKPGRAFLRYSRLNLRISLDRLAVRHYVACCVSHGFHPWLDAELSDTQTGRLLPEFARQRRETQTQQISRPLSETFRPGERLFLVRSSLYLSAPFPGVNGRKP